MNVGLVRVSLNVGYGLGHKSEYFWWDFIDIYYLSVLLMYRRPLYSP